MQPEEEAVVEHVLQVRHDRAGGPSETAKARLDDQNRILLR